jgi:uncharacterized protein (TIGR03437 family)
MDILYAGQAPSMVAGAVQINAQIPLGVQPWLRQVGLGLQVQGLTTNAPNLPFDYAFANPVTIWLQDLGNQD